MKQFSYLMCLLILLGGTGTLSAQKKDKKLTKKEAYNLGYAFGAQMGQSLRSATMLTEDEKNVDEFLKGFKESLKGDSLTLAKGQEAMQARIQSQEESTTAKAGGKIAYNIGLTSGLGNLAQKIDIPASMFNLKGMKAGYLDGLTKDSLGMTRMEIDSILKTNLEPKFNEYQEIMKKEVEGKAAIAIEAGIAFLAANKEKEGIITTASGLQYEVIKEGTGAKPTLEDQVKTHYHGTLIDGTVFDSSVDRGKPIDFPLSGVIKGWQEGIPLMSIGAKYRFFIPQELAYGLQSPSPKIPAGSTLIFEVELLDIPVDPAKAELNTNLEIGEAFLAENGKKNGVVTLPSGLQYLVIIEGSGPKPTLTDRVKVHYHGTLIDGTVFDSSVNRGTPSTFGVNQVVKGWQEGIPLMSVGAKYRLFIPARLAYGNRGAGAKIKAGSTLIFDVELFEINPK